MNIKRHLIAASTLFACTMAVCNSSSAQTREQRLQDHLYYLASDELQGREAGTEFSAKAAEYLIEQYEKIGVEPFFEQGWKMPFEKARYSYRNFFDVVGVIKGSDPVLCNEYIILGAHFDHLGVHPDGSVYNGADDNASGSSALIEIARQLKENQSSLKRSVIIAGFDGEEIGLYGSYALAEKLKEQNLIDKVKLMVSLDMVGWLEQSGSLKIEGTGTIKNGKETLERYAGKNAINVNLKKFEREIMTATDTQGFAELGVATLDMTTGTKSPYHKPEDDPELIDYKGLDRICGYVAEVTTELASNKDFGPSGRVAPKHRNKSNLIQIAPKVGIGSAHFILPDAGLISNVGFEYEGGLSAKLNFGRFAIMASGLYESSSSVFPIEEDVFKSKGKFTQKSITVPGYFMLQSKSPLEKIFIGVGPVYRHVLDSKFSDNVTNTYDVKQDQLGWGVMFGFGLGPYTLSGEFRNPLSSIFENEGVNARLSSYTIGLSYWF